MEVVENQDFILENCHLGPITTKEGNLLSHLYYYQFS